MIYSPLRYPGGKSSLYDFLKKTIRANNIVDGIYIEPFAGGAGAALKLLMLEEVYEIHLNDKDELIYKFWYSVLNHTDELIELINNCNIDINEWNYRKRVLQNLDLRKNLSDVEIGFTAFFLNRCNRSGILKAGIIGGINQAGDWKLDARFNKEDLISKIKMISNYKDRIKVYNLDALDFLKYVERNIEDKQNLMIYLDPPYVEQGEGLYNLFYKEKNHTDLAKLLQKKISGYWIVSYDDNKLIHSIYKEVNKNIFEFNYFANKTKVGRELIICSKNCQMPEKFFHYSKAKIFSKEDINSLAV